MSLFIHCYSKGHDALQVTALQILSDMLATHPSLLLPVAQQDSDTVSPPAFQKPLLKVFAKALKATSPASVQSAAATALSKLLLTNTFSPSGPNVPPVIKELNESSIETLLQSLVVSFFHPRTRENPVLRQSLAYFFPVYCHSRLANTQRMRRVAVPVVRAVLNATEEFFSLEAEEDSDGDIDQTAGEREVKALMTGVIGMLVEWTDERRVVGLGGENILAGAAASSSAHGYVHLALVKDILERVLGISTGPTKCSKEEKKLLISMLSKVYISAPVTPPSRAGSRAPEGGEDVFRSSGRSTREEIDPANVALAEGVKALLDQALEEGAAPDATGRNALVKVKNTILKILAFAAQSQAAINSKDASGRSVRAGTEDAEYTSADSRASREPSVIGNQGVPEVIVDETIVEEDEAEEDENENDDTVIKIKAERNSQEPE
jgi:condensin complex subunit 3